MGRNGPSEGEPRRPSLGRGTAAAIAADVLNGLVTVIGVRYLVDWLGVEAYGTVGVVAVLVSQLAWLQLGVGPATTRRMAEAEGRRSETAEVSLFAASALAGLVSGVIGGVFFVVVGPWLLGRAVGEGPLLRDANSLAAAGGLTTFALSLSASGLACALGRERFLLVAALRAVQGAGRVFVAVLAAGVGLGLTGVVWAQAALDLASAVCTLALVAPPFAVLRQRARLAGLVPDLLRLGLPFAATGGLTALLTDAEKIVLAWARPIGEFAFYSVPHNAALRLSGIATAFAGNLVPRLAFLGAASGLDATLAMMRRANRMALGLVGGVISVVVALMPELLGAWLGADFAALSTTPARLLLVVVLVNTAGSTFNAFLRARARPVLLVGVYLVQIPPYAVLLYLLVQSFGVAGAAVALLLRSFLDLWLHRLAADRALGVPVGGMVDTLGALLPLLGLTLLCEAVGPGAAWARGLAGLAVGVAIAFRLLSRGDWEALMDLVWTSRSRSRSA